MASNKFFEKVEKIRNSQNEKIVGQESLTNALLISLLCEGHLLIEGLPGLAKTRAVKNFAGCVSGTFGRIQFTPDMLPSDITGNDVFDPESSSFKFIPGPVFGNIILADEINRAPAKVQSALLEAMQERQITVNGNTYPLPSPFLVMATQNPKEQEGTFVLPEAQRDRFLMNIVLSYPSEQEELDILRLVRKEAQMAVTENRPLCNMDEIKQMQEEVRQVYVSNLIEQYIVRLVQATRPENTGFGKHTPLKEKIIYGAGPRATLALDKCARAVAWLSGRDFVSGDDVKQVAKDVLRHRIKLSLKAFHEGWDADKVLDDLLLNVSLS
ncbi:MoxR family ATPase [Parabacteroides merdae]|uniref:AAA family ATPase n=1 Tax=Bacteroidales TaxID=171549 RepID=UPI0039B4B190